MHVNVVHLSTRYIAFMYDVSTVEINGVVYEPNHFTVLCTE